MENSIEAPQKSKYKPAISSSNSIPKEFDSGTCTPMFIAALFTRAKLWKQSRCPTTDEWIKKSLLFIYNRILSFAENIILSQVRQVQKANRTMFSLICGI
jgi:hypothetical protein